MHRILKVRIFLLAAEFVTWNTNHSQLTHKTLKKISIILNVILLLVSAFFIVFAQIQTDLAMESQARADRLADETVLLIEKSEQTVKEAEAEVVLYKNRLEECQSNQ